MIQLGGFIGAKEIARLPFARQAGQHFGYYIDLPNRWETAADPRTALELIGSFNISSGNLPDLRAWLGELTDEEERFRARYVEVFRNVAALTTTVPVSLDTDADLYETLLDTRILQRHLAAPRRVLDIGPGSGRHLLNLALRPWGASSSYVGVESVGLPYVVQNLVGGMLGLSEPSWQFVDQLDYDLARITSSPAPGLEPRHAWHVPLWRCDVVPSQSFDLIICNYVLDELSVFDFQRIVDLVKRCLAPDGVLYCRGGQQRSMFQHLYHYGFGNFHQQDITATLLERGLQVKSCELIASTLTRVLTPGRPGEPSNTSGYAALRSDIDLVAQVQHDYISAAVDTVKARAGRVLLWADPGYQVLGPLLEAHLPDLNVVGMTNDQTGAETIGPFGLRQVPLAMVKALEASDVLIAGFRTQLAVRELREALGPNALGPVRQFNLPFAHARIAAPEHAG